MLLTCKENEKRISSGNAVGYNVASHDFQEEQRVNGKLFASIQHILPHHLISRAVSGVAECTMTGFKNALIKGFANHFMVDMSEAQEPDLKAYKNFNDFFTRPLKDGVRPQPEDKILHSCPADGAISQIGDIRLGRIYQAKGHDYSLTALLGGDTKLADEFMEGKFATIYLSPRDYHRVHMPVKGTLRSMTYVPGRLFSVNQDTAENVPGLFARNERVVCIFDTDNGPVAMILVGAMIVASIETVWAGLVTPPRRILKEFDYTTHGRRQIKLKRGDEMGRFKLGSTVIMLYGRDQIEWLEGLSAGDPVRMGQALAKPVAASTEEKPDNE